MFRCLRLSRLSLFRSHSNKVDVKVRQEELMKRGLPKVKSIPGVKHIILVASGKGGVGKSTATVNLAAAMKQLNFEVGILDTDVFGPSIPIMMNLSDTPLLNENNLMEPLVNYGIKCMSMGFLIAEDAPVIWRGLMVMQALDKLFRHVHWGTIDYLFVDTPPGTGDTHLSIIQNIPVTGSVLVTTPQIAAIQVTKRSAIMFQKLKVPIIGLIENMSHVKCTSCHEDIQLFGNGTEKLIKDLQITCTASLPLDVQISDSVNKGIPIVLDKPESSEAQVYKKFVKEIVEFCK